MDEQETQYGFDLITIGRGKEKKNILTFIANQLNVIYGFRALSFYNVRQLQRYCSLYGNKCSQFEPCVGL